MIKLLMQLKMKNITKLDILFFFLGLITFFMMELIYNWDSTKKYFMDGWNDSHVGHHEIAFSNWVISSSC